ncbi:MAG: DUF4105 domain-containing protein [Proteobacteria bacterium]|nr:DUF4105 domain-containing protein [Pseudomonadota bacterium]
MVRIVIALAILLASVGAASARTLPPVRNNHAYIQANPEQYPVGTRTIELITMGVGGLIWERHGHIALCVVYVGVPGELDREDCYNYGVGDFQHPATMGWGFVRGTQSFYVKRDAFEQMMYIYYYFDRTIWRQPLNFLDEAAKKKIVDKLELDIRDENKFYAYDHFADNCTTRVRDILDNATDGSLKKFANDPLPDRTFRDLARDGFAELPNGRIPLIITDIAMGRSTDRVPTYWERMFLPQYLREAVADKWGKIPPIVWYQRTGEPAIPNGKTCSDGSVVVASDSCEPDGPSGRVVFLLITLGLTASAWATRLIGRFQRTGLAFAVVPAVLLGLVFWFLAIVSPLPYMHINETCLVLVPLDFGLLVFPKKWRQPYARGRVAMLGLVFLLGLVGVLTQPIWYIIPWALIPLAVVGFWAKKS